MNSLPRQVGAAGLTNEEPPELPYQDPRTAVILRVASSSGFTLVQTLFLHVMRNALAGRDDLLTEVKIGHRVFGRPAVYNASEDTIVRAQMRLPRRKLEAYFTDEARSEPIIITIPRESYEPRVELRVEQTTATESIETISSGWLLWPWGKLLRPDGCWLAKNLFLSSANPSLHLVPSCRKCSTEAARSTFPSSGPIR